MGEVTVSVDVENLIDRELHRLGHLSESEIRRLTLEAVVDTGAVMSMLPEEYAEQLGLQQLETVSVRYADERSEERPVVGSVRLTIQGRSMTTDFIVGPRGSEMLIGQVVLEVLDFLVDCARQQLVPHPDSPDRPTLKLK